MNSLFGRRIVSAPTPRPQQTLLYVFVWPFLASLWSDHRRKLMSIDHAKAIAARQNWIPFRARFLFAPKVVVFNLFVRSTYGLMGSFFHRKPSFIPLSHQKCTIVPDKASMLFQTGAQVVFYPNSNKSDTK